MIITVKKLWMGHASVRDYIIRDLLAKNDSLTIKFNDQIRDYTPQELKKYIENTYHTPFKSKFNNETYYLIDLPFN